MLFPKTSIVFGNNIAYLGAPDNYRDELSSAAAEGFNNFLLPK